MRDLQNLVSERDVTLGGSLALIHAHKLSSVVDKEAVGALEVSLGRTPAALPRLIPGLTCCFLFTAQTRVKTEVKSCGEAALLQAGLFLWHTGKFERARDIADKLIKMNANSARWERGAGSISNGIGQTTSHPTMTTTAATHCAAGST